MAYQFSAESEAKFQKLENVFPDRRSLVIPSLYLVQRDQGFLDRDSMHYVSERIGGDVSLAHVYGVATFYTLYNKKPVGKFHIQVCATSSCYLKGSDKITDAICKKLNIEVGETTSDKKYTLDEVECLGACGYGPMAQINDKYYENLTPEEIERLLDEELQ